MIQTIIAPSIHRAKQIERFSGNPLARSLTLDNFIQAYYDRYGTMRIISADEALSIMASFLMAQNREHFDYITADGEAMEQIASFSIDLKRNNVTSESFGFVSAKQSELSELYTSYNAFLKKFGIGDRADMERFVLDAIMQDKTTLSVFGEIIVDDFTQNDVHFETSKTQYKLLELLRSCGTSMSKEIEETNQPNFYEPTPAPFGLFDEVASALKIARTLLDAGESSDDILIVVPAIDEYAPVFESLYEAYGLQGYTSIGTPLSSLLPQLKKSDYHNESELFMLARNRQSQIKIDVEKTSDRLASMGIGYNTTVAYEKAVEQSRIKSRSKVGLLLTEPNQLLSIDRVKHLIFLGTDMGHFPPVSKEGFLASTQQRETLLHANSLYLSSLNHYTQMKAVAENIYIVTATYKGKTKLARSHLITEKCAPFDISGILAPFELPRVGKRIDDPQLDSYFSTIALSESPYDGYDAGGYEAKTLSASQLGSYAMCPRRYFFDRVLKISAPGTPEEGLDASEKGTIMHKCFELFAIDAKAGKITIGSEVDTPLKNYMIDKAKIAYEIFLTDNELTESINHRLYFQELTRGLSEDDEAQGVLSNFLQFITENHVSINGFRDSEFEMEFRLDRSFNAIGKDQPYFIKGYIDRIDIKDDEIRIVDYKSKKANGIDKAKLAQMTELKDMQLALYILYARRAFGDKKIESYLQTFKSGNVHAEFAKAATYEVGKEGEYLHYDEAFEQSLIDKIEAIKTSMAHGDFHYDDSDKKHCEYCDFAVMCR
jgi:RecB family exonuclease